MVSINDPKHFGRLASAIAAFEAQDFDKAQKELAVFLETEPAHAQAVDLMVRILLQNADFAGARDILFAFVEVEQKAHYAHYMLGTICEQLEDFEAACIHFAKALTIKRDEPLYYLYLGAALERAGDAAAAVQVFSLGTELDDNIRHLHKNPQAAPQLRDRSAMADASIRATLTALHSESVAKVAEETGEDVTRIMEAIWPQTHTGKIKYKNKQQQPSVFYVPRLRDQAIFEGSKFPWVTALEKSFASIRSEVEAELNTARDGEAYVKANRYAPEEWSKLKGSMNWTSLHLFLGGEELDAAKRFPKTVSAIKKCPLAMTAGQPMEVFFSILRPDTHIPPHFGQANNRITVHLPIFVSKNCAIRVGDHQHEWKPGKSFLFDDSFEHEAWNRGDGTRTVLIFEIWHPELTDAEKKAIDQSFADRIRWHNERAIPDRFHPDY